MLAEDIARAIFRVSVTSAIVIADRVSPENRWADAYT